MSSGNCPETPRQKMIGMMYIVLLAMLALNVSKDILDVFELVLKGLDNTIENFESKNMNIYADFGEQRLSNPDKVGKWADKAEEVKKKSNELFVYIHQLKMQLVLATDGEEGDTTFQNLVGKDNTIAPAYFLIGSNPQDETGKGFELKGKIESYRKDMLEIIKISSDSSLFSSIKLNLNTDDPPAKDGVPLSWAEHYFEHYPLVGVLTILSKIQSDVRNVEADVIGYLYSQIDAASFKFNKLTATVIPKSDYVLKGERYEAQVFLAAVDTTKYPEIFIDGQSKALKITDGKGIYTASTGSVGTKKWSGVIKFESPDGKILNFRFNKEYQVAEPSLVVAPTKMNIFYVGVDNPVSISVPGVPSNKIEASISNGTIKRKGSGFIVRPKSPGKQSIIKVKANFNGQYKDMGAVNFRVKTVPDPVAKVGGKRGGIMKKSTLSAQTGVLADLEDFDFDLKFKVTGFTISMVDAAGYTIEQGSQSGRFTKKQKDLIQKIRRNKKIYFDNIKAVGPDGSVRELSSIIFTVK